MERGFKPSEKISDDKAAALRWRADCYGRQLKIVSASYYAVTLMAGDILDSKVCLGKTARGVFAMLRSGGRAPSGAH